jgi:hypothetical protein
MQSAGECMDEKIDNATPEQVDNARKYTYELMTKFGKVIQEFLDSEAGFKHNDKLLIVTRAVNGHAIYWGQNLFRALEDIESEAKSKVKQ